MGEVEHVLSYSYGKDSGACIGACKELGWPIDRIVTADIWATDTIPVDLPAMVEFKAHADELIMREYGLTVEHYCAMREGAKNTYERQFYATHKRGRRIGAICGWPMTNAAWCNSRLKMEALNRACKSTAQNSIQYIGIAADEPKRIERHINRPGVKLPLVELGWTEADCRAWCEEHDLLSPIYTTWTRGGCWFCHNQGVDQLRQLRKNHPELWALMLKWDADSPVSFKPDGHTVEDYDLRFRVEDEGLVQPGEPWRWSYLNAIQLRLF